MAVTVGYHGRRVWTPHGGRTEPRIMITRLILVLCAAHTVMRSTAPATHRHSGIALCQDKQRQNCRQTEDGQQHNGKESRQCAH